jgi:hypothetical protein
VAHYSSAILTVLPQSLQRSVVLHALRVVRCLGTQGVMVA